MGNRDSERRKARCIPHDVGEHVLSATVVIIEGEEHRSQTLRCVVHPNPRGWIGRQDLGVEVRRARRKDRGVVREVAVDREPLHPGPLGDGTYGCPSRPHLAVQRHDSLDDPLTGLGLPLRALPHLVFARLH